MYRRRRIEWWGDDVDDGNKDWGWGGGMMHDWLMVLNGGKVSLEVQRAGSLEMKVWDGGKEWNGLNVMGIRFD